MPGTDYDNKKNRDQNFSRKVVGKDEVVKKIEPGIIYFFPNNFRPCEDEAVTKFMLCVIRYLGDN